MDYAYNKKYFKTTMLPSLIAGIVVAIGVIIVGVTMVARTKGLMPIRTVGILLAVAGIVYICFARGGMSNEDDLNRQIKKKTDKALGLAMERFKLEEKHIGLIKPYEFGDYDFPTDKELFVKKGSDGKLRTSEYTYTVMIVANLKLYVYIDSFSFVEERDNIVTAEIPLEKLESIKVEPAEYVNGEIKNKYDRMHICVAGSEEITVPAHNDADSDKYISELFRFKDKNCNKEDK